MHFDAALSTIDGLSGAGLDLGDAAPAYPDFPRGEHQRRYARLAALMEEAGLEAIVLTQEEPIRYFSGYTSVIWAVGRWLPTTFLATRDPRQAVLIPSAFDVGAVHGTSWVGTLDGHADPTEIPGKVRAHIDRLGIPSRAVGLEWGPGAIVMLPFPVARALAAAVGDGAQDASRIVSAVRMLKSEAERARQRRATRATVAGYRAAVEGAKAGMTEKELVALCGSTMHSSGITAGTRPLFLNCVAGPDRYALVDTTASDRALRDGDVVFLDGGGGSDGYMSDIIRLIAIGDIGEERERLAALAEEALHAALDAVRPGAKASAVFEAGIGVYEDAGLGAYAGGIAGHGIGLEIWERPFIRRHDDPAEDITLRAGMTLCIEPILVPPGDDGSPLGVFVFEQQVAVTADGYELLSDGLEPSLWRVPA